MYGYAPAKGRFLIDLVPEYDGKFSLEEGLCLRLTVDIDTYHIIRNSYAHGGVWFAAETDGYSGLLAGRYFQMTIVVQMYSYEILINGYHFTNYQHRIPFTKRMWIMADQHIRLEPIEYN